MTKCGSVVYKPAWIGYNITLPFCTSGGNCEYRRRYIQEGFICDKGTSERKEDKEAAETRPIIIGNTALEIILNPKD